MDSRLKKVPTFSSLLLLPFVMVASPAQGGGAPSAQGTALVERALANELNAARDTSHPMRYRLRKSSPRFTSTKEIIETHDGSVALLVAVDDRPPSQADAQKDQARLDSLLADPDRQRHRKQTQDDDTARALKVLRALPRAFLYQYAGSVANGSETVERFTFTPNPRFNPPDLETQALVALTGEISIDAQHERVVRLEGRLRQDVDFGWGILGRLNKGGWIVIEQADTGDGLWRVVRFKMAMSGRVFFKTRSFDTTEEESQFVPVPLGLSYQKAIQMLRGGLESGGAGRR
jgi:hypothetical protein